MKVQKSTETISNKSMNLASNQAIGINSRNNTATNFVYNGEPGVNLGTGIGTLQKNFLIDPIISLYVKKYGELIHKPNWGLYLIKTIRAPVIKFPCQQSTRIANESFSTFPCEFSMISEDPCNKKGILFIPSALESVFAKEIYSYPYRTRLLVYFWHSGRKFKIMPLPPDFDLSCCSSIDDLLSWIQLNMPELFRLRKHHIIDRLRKTIRDPTDKYRAHPKLE